MEKSPISIGFLAAAFTYVMQKASREKRQGVNMRCLSNKILRLIVYCSTICLSTANLGNAIEYEYTELLPPGWQSANAMDINDSGTVVGYGYDDAGTQTGFIYSEGEYTELMPPGCNQVWVFKINNRGEVLMDGYNCILVNGYTECYRKVFLYSDDTYKELLPPGCEEIEDIEYVGDCFTAYDINDSGTVVGKMMKWTGSPPTSYTYRGVIYSEENYTELKPMWWDVAAVQDTFAINDIGTIVRSKTTIIGLIGWHAAFIAGGFIYNGYWYTKLLMPGWPGVFPSEINNRGVVVGWGLTDYTEKGFIYDKGIHITLLPKGWEWANAYDINESGTVIGRGGERITANGDEWVLKGFTYSKGEYTEVLPPGWSYAETYHINESGMVVGFGDNNFSWKGFIAVPQEE